MILIVYDKELFLKIWVGALVPIQMNKHNTFKWKKNKLVILRWQLAGANFILECLVFLQLLQNICCFCIQALV